MKLSGLLLLGLAVAWALWSGHYSREPLIFTFGVVSCLFVWWLVGRMDRAGEASMPPVRHPGLAFFGRLIAYLPWLFGQIVLANLHVARLILHPSMPIAPRLVRVKAGQQTPVCQVLHANSITLTPGTITLDLRDGELLVHALDEASALGVEEGHIDRRVSRVEGTV